MSRLQPFWAAVAGALSLLGLLTIQPRAEASRILETVKFVVEAGAHCATQGEVYIQGIAKVGRHCENPAQYENYSPYYLSDAELTGYTGLPWGDNAAWRAMFPHYPCIASVPGPWNFDTCPTDSDVGVCPRAEAKTDKSTKLGDPVDITTGSLAQTATDLDLSHGLRFERHYSSANAAQILTMGRGWEHSLQWSLQRFTNGDRHVADS